MEKLRRFFFSIFASTLAAFGLFLAIIFNFDPQSSDIITLGALFASIFFAVSGFLTLVIFYLRVRLSNWEVIFAQVPVALRHATLIGLALTGTVFLRTIRVLGYWEAGLYILIVILLEAYFKTRPYDQKG